MGYQNTLFLDEGRLCERLKGILGVGPSQMGVGRVREKGDL